MNPVHVDSGEVAHRRPSVSQERIRSFLQSEYGIEIVSTRDLGGERDQNLSVLTDRGDRLVVRIANAAEPQAINHLLDGLSLHLAQSVPGLPLAPIVPTRDACPSARIDDGDLVFALRISRFIEGVPLSACKTTTPAQAGSVGRLLAQLDQALATFRDPAADRSLLWDVMQAAQVRPLIASIEDDRLRTMCRTSLDAFETDVLGALQHLPRQVIHNDANPHNILLHPRHRTRIVGLIDFGDVLMAPRVVDLASALAYLPMSPAMDVIAAATIAYHEVEALTEDELQLLPGAMAARLLLALAITAWRAKMYPENAAYIMKNVRRIAANMHVLSELGWQRAFEILADGCRRESHAEA